VGITARTARSRCSAPRWIQRRQAYGRLWRRPRPCAQPSRGIWITRPVVLWVVEKSTGMSTASPVPPQRYPRQRWTAPRASTAFPAASTVLSTKCGASYAQHPHHLYTIHRTYPHSYPPLVCSLQATLREQQGADLYTIGVSFPQNRGPYPRLAWRPASGSSAAVIPLNLGLYYMFPCRPMVSTRSVDNWRFCG
jgi:hypothetical protein